MTPRDLVSASLRLIGALAPGETPAAQEATDGLAALNSMVSSWSTESLMIYARVREEFTLTPGTRAYTIGSGANFNTARPQRIEAASLKLTTSNTATEVPIDIVDTARWAITGSKDIQSEIPQLLYIEGTYPNDTLNLWPVPSQPHKLVLYSWKALTTFPTLDTAIELPPGYEEALKFNLALRLAPEYGKVVTDVVGLIAVQSKASIKRLNHRPTLLRADAALLSHNRQFDYRTGDVR